MYGRKLGVVIAALVVAVSTPLVVAAPAHATAYRYWTYWHVQNDAWKFSGVGATGWRPSDGGVEGWRFAVSPGTATAPKPRQGPDSAFGSICGSTAAESGKKRVALVVDFGIGSDADSGDSPPSDPLRGTCVVLPTTANGWDTLVAAGYAIRSDSGLVCALSGYPTSGCGEVVADPKPSSAPTTAKPTGTSEPETGSATSPGSGSVSGNGTGANGGAQNSDATTSAGTGTSTPNAASTNSSSSSASPTSTGTSSATARSSDSGSATTEPNSGASPTLVIGGAASNGPDENGSPLVGLIGISVIAGLGIAAVRARRAR